MACAVLGSFYLGLSVWATVLLYSLSGTGALLFVAWRKFRCMELHAE